MFNILPAPRAADEVLQWETGISRYSRIIGYTAFGDFFLRDPQSSELAVYLTLEGSVEETGYNDMEEFVSTFLTAPDIVTHVLRLRLLAVLEARLGPLAIEEIYYPVPFPFIGGSGEPDSFCKGNVWVFASIVGQHRGFPMRVS